MKISLANLPEPENEPVWGYAPGSPERAELQAQIKDFRTQCLDIPMVIGGKKIRTQTHKPCVCPHDHGHVLAHFHVGNEDLVQRAIQSALDAKQEWSALPWENRASIFLKMADLISGPWRQKLNAATMLGQSKNAFQSEVDAVCELADFLRFNVKYMQEIYAEQPRKNANATWNRLEYRPLEGFVAAVTPFNFTCIAANLALAPAMLGNVVVWKPADTQCYSAHILLQIFEEAGLPPGVINAVFGVQDEFSNTALVHPELAGIHFTGSTTTFRSFWKTIGRNIDQYRSYPRIVGETGGKDFIIAHPSANPLELTTAMVRGAFEFQGQKCSAVSRVYLPESLWEEVQSLLSQDVESLKMGPVENFGNFVNAVIDQRSFDKISSFIDDARKSPDAKILMGGGCDDSLGFYIEPTVILASKPDYKTLQEEIFGPVMTIYVYPDSQWEETLKIVDSTSPYALTGAVFSRDRYAIDFAMNALRNSAGNFYINDKPTGAVVGQQPFGGGRASGTNDKAGAKNNLLRWLSPRTIKESFLPPTDYRYPFLKD
jgi:1-pyrroline-5-carboxylate dehydrogenase